MIKTVTSGKTYLFLFWIILFVMQNRLQQWFEPFQYLDELFGFSKRRIKLYGQEKGLYFLLFC